VLLSVAGAAALVAVGPHVVTLVFGSDFAAAGTPLRVLAGGLVGRSVMQVLGNDFSGRGRPWLTLGTAGIGLAVNVGLNVLLIPPLGASGAALVSTATYTLTGAVMLWLFRRSTETSLRRCLVATPDDLARIARAIRPDRS